MRQKSGTQAASSEQVVKDIRLIEITRSHSANGKRIVFEDAFGRWQEPLFDGASV